MTDRAIRYQQGLIAKGLCPHCRQPVTDTNPRTGRLYQYCQVERKRRRLHRKEFYWKVERGRKPRK